jgi:hypothetical protein
MCISFVSDPAAGDPSSAAATGLEKPEHLQEFKL